MNTQPVTNRKLAAERQVSLSRRHFLRGLGACMALPAFESLRPTSALAASAPPVPVRMAFLYVPNGIIPSAWWPESGVGREFALPRTLEPLNNLRDQIQLVSGLDDVSANPGPDGGGDHARAGGTFLTGVRIKKTGGADVHAGVSIDQVVANKIGHLMRFPSLELSCDIVRNSGECDTGYACAYEYNLAWRSATQPLSPEPNPRLVFERLFGAGARDERSANLKRRQQDQRSLLDFVLEDANAVQRKLNGRDREKLDQYLSSVREIELRIQRAESMPAANPEMDAPAGIPASYEEYIALTFDMLTLAFQTDSTRVATLLLAREGSNRTFPEVGITSGHHDLTHHQNRQDMIEKVKEIDLWYVKQLAKFLTKLDQTKDVDGNSLLHNSMIVYGSGNADGNRHTHVNLPILMAGAGGGAFKPGRYIKAGGVPITNLYLSMADRMGAKGIEKHGDSTGRLEGVVS